MRNLLDQKPSRELTGLPLANASAVAAADIASRSILDIGCGFGWFELFALGRHAREVVGIELSDRDLETARKNVLDPRVRFQVGSALELPFESGHFHTVVAWEVLEHLPKGSEPQMFREAHRVLKPGGAFYLSTPRSSLVSNALDPAWWLTGHRHYSPEALGGFAAQAGFALAELRSQGGIWTVLSIVNLYVAKWIFRRRPFWERQFDSRVATELREGEGFADVFVKCIKRA